MNLQTTRLHLALAMVGLGAICVSASAQTQADIDAASKQAEIRQRQAQEQIQRDIDALRPTAPPLNGIDASKLMPKVDTVQIEGPCRTITQIQVRGADALPARDIAALVAKYQGTCMASAELEALLADVTKLYIDRGYITTRAYLPSQDLTKGKLDVLVVQGVVEKITINDGGTNSINPSNAVPSHAGKLLDLRDFEQAIDQINRLSSNSATMDIKPGDILAGSEVVISNTPSSRNHFSVTYDNQGSETTGKDQLALTFSRDHLLGLNENIAITHRQSLPGDREQKLSESDSLSVAVPLGYSTLSYAYSSSYYANMVKAPSGLFLQSRGVSTSDNLKLDHLAFRNANTRLSFSGAVTMKSARNYFAGVQLGVSSRDLSVLDVGTNYKTDFAGGHISVDLGMSSGLTLGSSLRDAENLPADAPRAQFKKYTYGLDYTVPFQLASQDLTFSSQWNGQVAKDVLYGSEQISIGGLSSVRGFVTNSMSGESGFYSRNELSTRTSVTVFDQKLALKPYVAYDHGEVRTRIRGVPMGALAGMTLGVSGNVGAFNWDLFNSRPVVWTSDMNAEAPQTWLRLTAQL